MKNIKTILIISGLVFLKSHLVAQIPNYSGIWVLNNEKSKIQSRPDGMTSSVFIIKQVENSFSLTIHHIFGDIKDTIIIKMLSDGKTIQVLNTFKGKLERKKDYLQITLWEKDFLDIVKYKFGQNKNQFIADEVLTSDSDNHHNTWVFDRQAPKVEK
jgi:hypothetical protein